MATQSDFKVDRKAKVVDIVGGNVLKIQGTPVIDTTKEAPDLLEVDEGDGARVKTNAEAINRINQVLSARFGIPIQGIEDEEEEEEVEEPETGTEETEEE